MMAPRSAKRWSEADDAYLAANYATTEMWRMVQHLDRSRDSITYRSKSLGLRRQHQPSVKKGEFVSGCDLPPGYEPWNMGRHAGILAELERTKERTVVQLCVALRVSSSTMWKHLARLKAEGAVFIHRWEPVPSAPGNVMAIYRAGAGVSVPRPERDNYPERIEYDATPQAIPRPHLGLWGLVWPTTPATPAEHGRAA